MASTAAMTGMTQRGHDGSWPNRPCSGGARRPFGPVHGDRELARLLGAAPDPAAGPHVDADRPPLPGPHLELGRAEA